jgi:hypothetical protein
MARASNTDGIVPLSFPPKIRPTEIDLDDVATRHRKIFSPPSDQVFDEDFIKIATSQLTFDDTYCVARTWNDGAGMFIAWHEKLSGPLTHAYRFFLVLLRAGDQNVRAALRDEFYAYRHRMPRQPKPALVAVQIVAKPRENRDKKACSTYALLLEHAARLKVMPDDFATRMATVRLCDLGRKQLHEKGAIHSEGIVRPGQVAPFPKQQRTAQNAIVEDPQSVLPKSGSGTLVARFEWNDQDELYLVVNTASRERLPCNGY